MNEITRSIQAMLLAAITALLWAISGGLAAIGYATYSGPQDYNTLQNLGTASQWMLFAAAVVGLSAVVYVTWTLFVARRWTAMWEVGGATISTLFIAIGLLIIATGGPNQISSAGNVISALGFGGWAIVVTVGAGRRALQEQENKSMAPQAALRLAAAGSLVVYAVGVGLPSPNLQQESLAIATASLVTFGAVGLAIVLSIARSRGLITTTQFSVLLLGLWLLALAGVAHAVASGLVLGSTPPSLLTYRVSFSIAAFIEVLAAAVLAWAAFGRMVELRRLQPQPQWQQGADEPSFSATRAVPPSWQADPTHRNELRWWDGSRWTDYVLNGNQPSVDPLPAPPSGNV